MQKHKVWILLSAHARVGVSGRNVPLWALRKHTIVDSQNWSRNLTLLCDKRRNLHVLPFFLLTTLVLGLKAVNVVICASNSTSQWEARSHQSVESFGWPPLVGFTYVANPVVSGSRKVMFPTFRILSRNCTRTTLWWWSIGGREREREWWVYHLWAAMYEVKQRPVIYLHRVL